jgi:hypothetical protein
LRGWLEPGIAIGATAGQRLFSFVLLCELFAGDKFGDGAPFINRALHSFESHRAEFEGIDHVLRLHPTQYAELWGAQNAAFAVALRAITPIQELAICGSSAIRRGSVGRKDVELDDDQDGQKSEQPDEWMIPQKVLSGYVALVNFWIHELIATAIKIERSADSRNRYQPRLREEDPWFR